MEEQAPLVVQILRLKEQVKGLSTALDIRADRIKKLEARVKELEKALTAALAHSIESKEAKGDEANPIPPTSPH